jgi:DNA repair protein RadA/Sms
VSPPAGTLAGVGKVRQVLRCSACGHRVSQWLGRCPACGEWGSIGESAPDGATVIAPVALGAEGDPVDARVGTGFHGFDRALGGGLVPGSVVLVAGEPGIGKSTLLLQVAGSLAAGGHGCLVASGEETRSQVAARARRLGLPQDASFVPGRELASVLEAARSLRPTLVVIDSIQAIRDSNLPSLPGGIAQVQVCADALVTLAKGEGISVILAGQVTKDGDLAGPRTLEHAVDSVCSFEGDPSTGLRVLIGGKNRFGPEGEVAWFEMASDGLHEVDPAAVLAPGDGETGAATALVAAGRRALAVEVQALAAFTDGPPRRQVSGLDPRRFGLIAAVVDRSTGMRLSKAELFGAAAGGLRVDDPGADLAVAAALASSASGVPPPAGSAFAGEVSLTGAVRPAPGLNLRLAAAAAAGVRNVYCAGDPQATPGVGVIQVRRLSEALRWSRPEPSGHRHTSKPESPGRPSAAPVTSEQR